MRAEFRGRLMDPLEAENTRLKVELEAPRPKPVVEVKSLAVRVYPKLDKGRVYWAGIDDLDAAPNVRFTFTDGVLTKAEVLSDK